MKSPIQITLVALRALLRNKLRSFLTTLGIIIGVGAVIAMTTIGAGARARVQKTFEGLGSNMLVVHSGASFRRGVRGKAGSQPTLTWSDLEAIKEELPSVRYAAPMLVTSAQVIAEGQNWSTSVTGTTPDFFLLRNWPVSSGDVFTQADVAMGVKVAVVGTTVVENLFGAYANPVGELIRINHIPFHVIGVASEKGQAFHGADQDDVIIVPVSTFRAKLQGGLQQFVDGPIFVGAVSPDAAPMAQSEIESLLRERHRIRNGMEDDFHVRNLSDIATAQQEGAKTMTSLLSGIAMVSLLVGGIGIMNIMLVSVTERTREIGLRMAVGAKPWHILIQFLAEAMTLSLIGGIIGIGCGLGIARYLSSRFDWPMLIQLNFVLISVAFSAFIGIVFGLYPAHKASRLDPIRALRYE